MWTYFKIETDAAQNLNEDFFPNFDCQSTFPYEGFEVN